MFSLEDITHEKTNNFVDSHHKVKKIENNKEYQREYWIKNRTRFIAKKKALKIKLEKENAGL